MADNYDPADHSVAEVLDYLDGADAAERERVLAAEAEGKGRVTITDATYASEETPSEEEVADEPALHPGGTGHVLQDGQWVLPEVQETEPEPEAVAEAEESQE